MLPWDLEDWLTEAGDDIVTRKASEGPKSLSPSDRLLYHVWLLDTEVRNGGVSQYFFNRGCDSWPDLLATLPPQGLPALTAFINQLMPIVSGARDPYAAITACGIALDDLYDSVQESVVRELKVFYEAAPKG